MGNLTNILFHISSGLLIPVVVLLIVFFALSIFHLGNYYDLYIKRRKFRRSLETMRENSPWDCEDPDFTVLEGNLMFLESLENMKSRGFSSVESGRIIADYSFKTDRKLNIGRILMRTGPMLGLMGTLIPMGPALTGLAAGDINSMAVNMQVAFATTVTGIFVGGAGYVLTLVKQRWRTEDITALEYIYDKMTEGQGDN